MANLRLSCLFQKTWIPPLCGTHRSGWASSNRTYFEPDHIFYVDKLSHCFHKSLHFMASIFEYTKLVFGNQFWAGSNHTCFEPGCISYEDKSLCFHESPHFLPFFGIKFLMCKKVLGYIPQLKSNIRQAMHQSTCTMHSYEVLPVRFLRIQLLS